MPCITDPMKYEPKQTINFMYQSKPNYSISVKYLLFFKKVKEGFFVYINFYWLRHLIFGDVSDLRFPS